MDTSYIYYTKWESCGDRQAGIRPTSHELLGLALRDYIHENTTVRDELACGVSDSLMVTEASEPRLVIGEHGKPSFADHPDIYFSISHSGDYWACAFLNEEVGLDLQTCDIRNWEKVAGRFFCPDEAAWLSGRPKEDFARMWAYKESYIKFTGEGVFRGLGSFSVMDDEGDEIAGCSDACQVEADFPEDGYCMVVTSRKRADWQLIPLKVR